MSKCIFTTGLAKFVAGVNIERLPKAVISESKKCFLDWIGVTLGGISDASISIILEVFDQLGGNRNASILGFGHKTNALNAALVNGIMSHVLDYDDAHSGVRTHPSAPIIPALFAVAEIQNVTGRDLLEAFVAGYETTIRIGLALGKEYYNKGWHSTAILGRFGATAATAKLIGLDEEQICVAFGLAATQAGGVRDVFGTMGKPFHVGKAASDGILSSLLANKGFTAHKNTLSTEAAFPRVLSSEYEPRYITTDLGADFHVLRNTFKIHAACLLIHPVIDGLVELKKTYNLLAEDIDRIDLEVAPLNLKVTDKRDPSDSMEGKFSIYLGAALAVVYGKASTGLFTKAIICSPEIRETINKTTVSANSTLGETEALIDVRTKAGDHLSTHVYSPKGDPSNPLSFDDLSEKMRDLSRPVLPDWKIDKIIETLLNLEKMKQAAELVRLCCDDGNSK